ncbi:hypothetical protein NMG46_00235 [Mesorhizobium sp. LMG 17147]|uniref:hypothetical protein n=1 Tax=Mesorhizobium sp. LMG 17147 TaxID=2963091 RepID=UPI0020CA18F4|nr:hypothetical protein [Mesorhizobium sp. LMG 17147]MCP9228684.1 hypothetical protein [Mesorhizobium sp. LMG 17147]
MEASVGQIKSPLGIGIDTDAAVHTAMADYHSGDILSTTVVIADLRRRFPWFRQTDEELVGFIVRALDGRQIAVSFDHRGR